MVPLIPRLMEETGEMEKIGGTSLYCTRSCILMPFLYCISHATLVTSIFFFPRIPLFYLFICYLKCSTLCSLTENTVQWKQDSLQYLFFYIIFFLYLISATPGLHSQSRVKFEHKLPKKWPIPCSLNSNKGCEDTDQRSGFLCSFTGVLLVFSIS